jgi:hypothetical protein
MGSSADGATAVDAGTRHERRVENRLRALRRAHQYLAGQHVAQFGEALVGVGLVYAGSAPAHEFARR